jgi:hypothetical protein
LNWGVKESFRKYLAGPTAAGKVEFGGGAADYRFGGGSGAYNLRTHAVTAGFDGSVRFLAHPKDGGYELDLTFADLGVQVEQAGAFLTADVTSKALDGKVSELKRAKMASLDVSKASFAPVDGVVTLDRLPATLTEQGATAFGGFYQAGAALDPVTATLAFEKGTTLPTPAPTSTTGAGTGGGAVLTSGGSPLVAGELASTGMDTPIVPLLATAAGLLLLGGGTTVLLRRRTGK